MKITRNKKDKNINSIDEILEGDIIPFNRIGKLRYFGKSPDPVRKNGMVFYGRYKENSSYKYIRMIELEKENLNIGKEKVELDKTSASFRRVYSDTHPLYDKLDSFLHEGGL
jgi:hypothetical protein